MQPQKSVLKRALLVASVALCTLCAVGASSLELAKAVQSPRQPLRQNSDRAIKHAVAQQAIDQSLYPLNSTKYPCGSTETNALRVEFCARPLMDLVEGKVRVWPESARDIADICTTVSSSFIAQRVCIA